MRFEIRDIGGYKDIRLHFHEHRADLGIYNPMEVEEIVEQLYRAIDTLVGNRVSRCKGENKNGL